MQRFVRDMLGAVSSCLWVSVVVFVNVQDVRATAALKGNSYEDVLVTLPGALRPRDPGEFFNDLETLLRRASKKLFAATDNLWYFGSVRVLLPPDVDMPPSLLVENATWELLSEPDIVVHEGDGGTEARALQSRGCGKSGHGVLLPIAGISSEDIDTVARSVVRGWAQVRYGVFEERAWDHQLCYKDGNVYRPTGCYTADVRVKPSIGTDGRPYCKPRDIDLKSIFGGADNVTSSLLFTSSQNKVERFCDRWGPDLHRPLAPTLHNQVCDARSAWEVIRTSPDYATQQETLQTLPATSFHYVRLTDHVYVYLIQTCSPENTDYKKVMAAMNEGFRRFVAFNGPASRRWRLVLFHGATIEVLDEFRRNDTWHGYLTHLDRTVRATCSTSDNERVLQNTIQLSPETPTTVVALLHSATARVVPQLEALKPHRLSVILFGANGTHIWNKPMSKVYVVPSHLDVESMAALVDLALFHVHHKTAALHGDAIKVFQETSIEMAEGARGAFSLEPSTHGTLSFLVACPDIYNVEDGSVRLDGEPLTSYRVKMSVFALEKALMNTSFTTWSYTVDSTRSDQKCSISASHPASENHVTLRGWFDRSTVRPSVDDTPQSLFAELHCANITNVTVQAILYASDITAAQPTKVQLTDDGLLEPDIRRGDGIYSAYFARCTRSSTWYSVLVRASGIILKNGAETTGRFYREEFVGSFWSAACTQESPDFPLQKIYDLRATVVSYPNFTLVWTAPRGYSSVRDSFYQIRYSAFLEDILNRTSFASLQGWDLPSTSRPGRQDSFKVRLPEETFVDTTTYFFALRTVNHIHRSSRISNIVRLAPEPPEAMDIELSTSGAMVPSRNVGENTVETVNTLPSVTTQQITDWTPTAQASSILTEAPPLYAGHFTKSQFYWIVAGTATAFVLIVIVVNCLVCLLCIEREKPKRRTKPAERRRQKDVGTVTEPDGVQIVADSNCFGKSLRYDDERTIIDIRPTAGSFATQDPSRDAKFTAYHWTTRSNPEAAATYADGMRFRLPILSVRARMPTVVHEGSLEANGRVEMRDLPRSFVVNYGMARSLRNSEGENEASDSTGTDPKPPRRSSSLAPGQIFARTGSGIYYNLGYV